MFKISNLRREESGEWVYLKCSFDVKGIPSPFPEDTMWLAVERDNARLLDDTVYDPFVLVPLILGMYYHQDVVIEGAVSSRLYHNVQHYLMQIFDNFSDQTKPIVFTADRLAEGLSSEGQLVGTGISCGVDSLTTIYDNFITGDDPLFRINSLFLVNTGTHGPYGDESRKRWLERAHLNRAAADELGLPMYLIDSNFHAFTYTIGEQKIGYLAIWSCVLGVQKGVRRYYASSNLSYDEVAEFANLSRDFDISEYCETYMPHLISTERVELVMDGCQYTRAEKTERISDWEFAQRHLNVCVNPIDHARNCSCCHKCMWTLIPLEAMGKLERFSRVFDVDAYKRVSFKWKLKFVGNYGKDAMETSIVRYCRKKGLALPPRPLALAATRAAAVKSKLLG